jgi:hypothetical protein
MFAEQLTLSSRFFAEFFQEFVQSDQLLSLNIVHIPRICQHYSHSTQNSMSL